MGDWGGGWGGWVAGGWVAGGGGVRGGGETRGGIGNYTDEELTIRKKNVFYGPVRKGAINYWKEGHIF